MSSKVRGVLAELQRRLEHLYGNRLVKLVLFGSQARGDAAGDSDIDVLVVLKGKVNPFEEIERGGRVTAEVSLEQDVTISTIYVSENRYRTGTGALLANVRSEGVSV
jgi:predicted nucleotidyltransferase